MGTIIKYPKECLARRVYYSRGRNGWVSTVAVNVTCTNINDDPIKIIPITSRDTSGSCVIELPRDKCFIHSLIDALQEVLSESEEARNNP